ncbi:hypothetical protein DERP_002779 [Dermatophagoides pteronyssinus]|uniref:Uncharacterized protein n=1 Tax=Dermatophagoides pteronyssinus TaxID=6956 RepID=A0ABQ8JVP7_DERPT|nr:hypothetical protein DERP_002779 [Dermatophagoides pteronyssinus]
MLFVKKVLQNIIRIIEHISLKIWPIILLFRCIQYHFKEFFRNFELFGWKKLNFDEEFGNSTICLDEKICVITGGTRGIGLETIKYLLQEKNISKIITGSSQLDLNSNENEIENFKQKILSDSNLLEYKDRLIIYPLNLGSMNSVVKFVEKICKHESKIDYLICNGGVLMPETNDDDDEKETFFNKTMAINYYGHCLLIIKLLKLFQQQQKSRIIIVTSIMHQFCSINFNDLQLRQKSYSPFLSYSQSKLASIMFTYRFNKWIENNLKSTNDNYSLTINCLHPGICRSSMIGRILPIKVPDFIWNSITRSTKEGAEPILLATLSPKLINKSGKYFEDLWEQKSSEISYDENLQQKLWQQTWQDLRQWLTDDEYNRLMEYF